jgi:hypothetical protein
VVRQSLFTQCQLLRDLVISEQSLEIFIFCGRKNSVTLD